MKVCGYIDASAGCDPLPLGGGANPSRTAAKWASMYKPGSLVCGRVLHRSDAMTDPLAAGLRNDRRDTLLCNNASRCLLFGASAKVAVVGVGRGVNTVVIGAGYRAAPVPGRATGASLLPLEELYLA